MTSTLAPVVAELRESLSIPSTARMVSRQIAANALGISVRLLDEMTAAGTGPKSIRAGTRRLYPVTELEKWIKKQIAHA